VRACPLWEIEARGRTEDDVEALEGYDRTDGWNPVVTRWQQPPSQPGIRKSRSDRCWRLPTPLGLCDERAKASGGGRAEAESGESVPTLVHFDRKGVYVMPSASPAADTGRVRLALVPM
jgi:hypothetical protein